MMTNSLTIYPGKLRGEIQIPSSKSDSQRAILAAALSQETSFLANYGSSEDEQNMLRLVKQMGADVNKLEGNVLEVRGKRADEFSGEYQIGEGGLAVRLLTTILSLNANKIKISGEGSLLKRSMGWFDVHLPLFGVEINSANGFLPFIINGSLRSAEVEIEGSQSSQYISGLLMALPLAKGTSRLHVKELNSKPYVQMTLNTLKSFGITIEHQNLEEFIIPGDQKYLPSKYTIEGDWSSASYWLIASALGLDVCVSGLSMTSLQADKKIVEALIGAGCSVNYTESCISIQGNDRHSFEFDATHCPDLFPALTTLAALTPGVSTIKGASRLTQKESDRGKVLQSEFEKLGVQIELEVDIMKIHGKSQIVGGVVSSHHDHRIAMCLAIAAKFADSPIEILAPECVSKSYDQFWKHLASLSKDA